MTRSNGVEIIRGVLSSDPFVSVPPKLAISDLMRLMKGRSPHKVQRAFPHLKSATGCGIFGTVGYFSTTNGASTEDSVLQYLEQKIANPTNASREWLSEVKAKGDSLALFDGKQAV